MLFSTPHPHPRPQIISNGASLNWDFDHFVWVDVGVNNLGRRLLRLKIVVVYHTENWYFIGHVVKLDTRYQIQIRDTRYEYQNIGQQYILCQKKNKQNTLN